MLPRVTTREKLIEAAIECLQERGYARTTTRDVVAAAGSHLPAVNYHFGSKQRLLEDAVGEALRRWTATTMSVANEASGADPRDRLHHSIARFLDTLEADRPYLVAAVEAFAQSERSDELRTQLAETYAKLRVEVARSLQPASAAGSAEPSPAALNLASVLIALFDGLALQWLMEPELAPEAAQVTRSLEFLGAALTGAGARGDVRQRRRSRKPQERA